jgi:hypothetical protein
MEPGEERKRSHQRDRRRDRPDHAAKPVATLNGKGEREHAEVGGDAAYLCDASLWAVRPTDPERGPGGKCGQESEAEPGHRANPREGKDAHERAQ